MTKILKAPTLSLALSAAAVVALSACGDSTGPDGPGMMEVVMYDGSSSAGASLMVAAEDSYSGTFQGEVGVQISTDGETWIDLSPPASATVDLQSDNRATVVSEVEVAGGSYSHIRVTMRSATAQIDAGAQIGGTILGASVNIVLGGGSDVVVEKEIFPFSIGTDVTMVLSVDLNSEAWVDAQSVDSRTVTSTAIASATAVEARRR